MGSIKKLILAASLAAGMLLGHPQNKALAEVQAEVTSRYHNDHSAEEYLQILRQYHDFTDIKTLKVLLAELLKKSEEDPDFQNVCQEMTNCQLAEIELDVANDSHHENLLNELLDQHKFEEFAHVYSELTHSTILSRNKITLDQTYESIRQLIAKPIFLDEQLAHFFGLETGWVLAVTSQEIIAGEELTENINHERITLKVTLIRFSP